MLLSNLQRDLAAFYETPVSHPIDDYLITSQRSAEKLSPSDERFVSLEKVLLRETDDQLELSVYIDDALLQALTKRDPYESLNGNNLNAFLIALEGVSHFNYLLWNARHDKSVTRFELELQAEIDKFVTTMWLLGRQGDQGDQAGAHRLHRIMFEGARYVPALSKREHARYREANHYAGKYCRHLTARFSPGDCGLAYLKELRRFYRLPQNDKIRSINCTRH